MTNERAIELLHRLQDEQFDGIHGDERREALSMAVRVLSGDGDTISRKMAIDAVAKWFYDVVDITESDGTATIFERLRELPSAQPERKKGRWEYVDYGGFGNWNCTACRKIAIVNGNENFCPNCGADMRGESDEML